MLSTFWGVFVYIRSWKHAEKQAKVSSSRSQQFGGGGDDDCRYRLEGDWFMSVTFWMTLTDRSFLIGYKINIHNFKELPMQGLIVFINNWSKQFRFGVIKRQVRVNGLPNWEMRENRQTTQLFSTKYWSGFHAEWFQIKVDSTSGIKHNRGH